MLLERRSWHVGVQFESSSGHLERMELSGSNLSIVYRLKSASIDLARHWLYK